MMKLKCLTTKLLHSVCVTLAIMVSVIALIPPTEVAAQEAVTQEQEQLVIYYSEIDLWQLARIIDAEYGNCLSYKERASVAWTVCNRASDARWSSNISEVIFQPSQFYVAGMPATPSELSLVIAQDVLARWNAEMNGAVDVGRTVPPQVCYFKGDGVKNHFSDQNRGGNLYEPILGPYEN